VAMYVDRVPPHDEGAEEAVLGSILVEGSSAIARVAPFLKPEDFFRERNRWTYEVCMAIYQRSEAIDQISVSHELGAEGRLEPSGGASFLSHLVATVPTSVYVEHYARIVSRTSIMRNLIGAATDIAALGYEQDSDLDGTLRQAEDLLFRVRSRRESRDFVPLREVLDKYLEDTASIQSPLEGGLASIQTGFVDLDRLLGGLQRSDLIILAARPSAGKSTLALNMARHAAGEGRVVAVFSLEMSREQLGNRMLAGEAGVDSHRLRLGLVNELEQERLIDAVGALSDLPLYIDDSPFQTVVELRSKAHRLQLEHGVDMIIVDYIQQMQGERRQDNRVQEMSDISRSLKSLARDLNAPVVAMSQLSRAVEMRPSHRPQLSDLRDSGSIEQDADVVAFIYREDMYYTEEEWGREHPDKKYPKSMAELIVAKHRNGPTGTVNLYLREQFSRFENVAHESIA
jgi:replicative DNA helicase